MEGNGRRWSPFPQGGSSSLIQLAERGAAETDDRAIAQQLQPARWRCPT